MQVPEKRTWFDLDWRVDGLPWLSIPAIVLGTLLICAPFLLVDVPPLIDVPGHMGAAAIEAAGPDSPLGKYLGFKWVFTLNIGGDVLMKVLGAPLGVLAAGWWSTVIATALFAGGCLATVRVVNARGGHGAPWALMWVFSFPLLTGFLNYILGTGLSLCAFAAAVALESRPRDRAGLLVVAQPLAMLCHAIGGLLLAVLVGANAFGREVDNLPKGWWRPSRWRSVIATHDWKAAAMRLVVLCWPLLATVLTIVLWKLFSPSPARSLNTWRWDQKGMWLGITLRDQSFTLDAITTGAAYLLLLGGAFLGGRWNWQRGLPGLCVLILYVVIPSDINGSAFVDVRLLPPAMMLLLGLQDWSGARPRVARLVAYSGLILLGLRTVVTAASFVDYADDYRQQLSALEHIEPGSRVLTFVEHSCLEESWRNTRRDHLASLASVYRQAWVNDNWAVPGLHMVVPRFRPARNFAADPSEFVWSRGCAGGRLRSIDSALRFAPVERVDYVWLIDTGLPRNPDPRLRLVWQQGRSLLFAVRPLGFPTWQPRDL
ncbi:MULTISPECIES: hypothetical protein [unclassified Novosphingobium]|uniref:hypothetical protein n=1 Tax=unclassified Novosphingobium TaxID=2644732 RepID=UPI00144768B8|nr:MULTISPECIES: hypothetical protein [unclassified Novosphingobium]NKJ42483.1 ABC-type sulfate transport system permease subunit [Novosphingobium sp. SG720]NMN05834.1 ABC-type sulfate transport system permease subunit [Novosphingobium sp. SG919]NMN87806.1 ABC-type sulfate transport system permease subunit [Novosphingobium sp. SG916]